MQRTLLLPGVLFLILSAALFAADPMRALPAGQKPDDGRLGPMTTLDGYFPFHPVADKEAWAQRAAALRLRVKLAAGLVPEPPRTPLNLQVFGRIERDDYTVEKVIFESMPGHYVTGNLYRPLHPPAGKKLPGVLCPHGHWPDGRFTDAGEKGVRDQIAIGAERFEDGGRSPLQARCVQLARMGCVVLHYDMLGYADSMQFEHRPGVRENMSGTDDWGFFSPRAELELVSMFGLQTWNSIRALDVLSSFDDVDTDRLAVTGASGGGTQTMMLCAIDDRIDLAFAAVMPSTAMQGGCTCENADYLRIGDGNIDLIALTAPRPLGLTAADDWTKDLATKGLPDLQKLYEMLGVKDNVAAAIHTEFKHNYNAVSRVAMSNFINRHFGLGLPEPVIERDYTPLTKEQMTVWDEAHPKPGGDQVGEAHERALTHAWAKATHEAMDDDMRRAAWRLILNREFDEVGEVTWDLTHKLDRGDHLVMLGMLTNAAHHEAVPAVFIHPKANWNHHVLLVLNDTGKAAVLADDRDPAIDAALKAGSAVCGIDLYMQGEFTDDGNPPTTQRMVKYGKGDHPWQHAACYTFGYNDPLFCQRVHDVLTAAHYIMRDDTHGAARLDVLAIGKVAGPVGAAAKLASGDAIHDAEVDPMDFRFESITKLDDAMMTPGAVRYGDVPALIRLSGARERGK
ncbi:MAG: acetylxylan esterase [Planctomycetes bacterium]|nr:acetylxylan esterase [Planctomycetota bacterium]